MPYPPHSIYWGSESQAESAAPEDHCAARGQIEIVDRELSVGESLDVVVSRPAELARRSAVDILDKAPGHLLFKPAEEVDSYLREERASWND